MTEEFPFTAVRQLKNQALVESLVKFLAWQEDKDLLLDHMNQDDYARHLLEVLGMDTDEVMPLIGGSNAPIFRHAAREIETLRERVDEMNDVFTKIRVEAEESFNGFHFTIEKDVFDLIDTVMTKEYRK